jgi:hypothetical protein
MGIVPSWPTRELARRRTFGRNPAAVMPIPASILERIETFSRNLESYLDPNYKEQRLREEFLNPFFAALGWDMANANGYAEAYKDVILEDSLKVPGLAASAPDYSFRIGGTRKFFVEAKKPSIRIKDDPAPAAQLRSYSYSAKLPLGIVTDFHEFAIYETRQRPRESDKASVGRVFYCTFDQFPQKWDEIAAIFSREAVLKGSFDKYAASTRGKRGTSDFDDDFLADLESWRDLLARNLALRNELTQRELNFAVQRILDRIIFLRIAEDRGIEPYGQLLALTAGPKIYPRLGEIFERADFRYNSGLFHFATEKGREEAPDKLTLRLQLDDAVLKEILGALYWPKSPYRFAVIPADILGHIYEQFLGKVIHLTSDHKARVEEKPEVRKAGGVYYTPTYIVNYIVEQTLRPLLDGKTPKQVEKIKVLDPACGSGSFLLGAYEFLLAWHLDYYLKHEPAAWAKKKHPPIYETAPNAHGVGQGSKNFLLTTAERKRILVNNLFGVDIDTQAVEVTKLSLLLKVLEGEARELQGKQLDFHRVLPDLGNNIKCGNSLIGSDFYAQPNLPEFDEEARYKINAFDWAVEFKPIMDAGGFDAVIGNPPYVVVEQGASTEAEIAYLNTYEVANYKTDLFHIFIERGSSLLRREGRLGMIVPNPWLTQVFTEPLREFIVSRHRIDRVVVFEHRVFRDANVDTCLIFFTRMPPSKAHLVSVNTPKGADISALLAFNVLQSDWQNSAEHRFEFRQSGPDGVLVKAILQRSVPLGERARASLGCQAYNSSKHTKEQITGRVFHALTRLSDEYLPELAGRDVSRYSITRARGQWIKYGPWLHDYRPMEMLSGPRVLVREIPGKAPHSLHACYVEATYCHYKTILNINPSLPGGVSMKLACGVLNSRLATFLFPRISNKKVADAFPRLSVGDLRSFPLPRVIEEKAGGAMVAHVERMLKLHEQLAAAKSPDAQSHLQRDIAATDRAIDQLVYQLYELTPEEIALVERATAPAAAKLADEEPAPAAPSPPPGAYVQAEADAAHHFFIKEPAAEET